ncbi:Hsp20 family protein [Altererythrobacter sp. Root672]|uniref:Hsp20 family protein n=1 Tax=Altererythrobacter sp. Root672 TaxID=1736584 RepID=UPI0006FBBBEC|nr:Hsp20 family protein [Altererythrobacter sp. Root672]KRA84684.1 hypothetical protein ASD76_08310 [Altererythrobacter sp. Root672]
MRTTFDFAPYRRSTVGFDRLFDLLETEMRGEGGDGYPAFDIAAEGEDRYQITLAVPGYTSSDIAVVARQNQLTVTGKRPEGTDQSRYLHQGILIRPFERHFQLADFIQVEGAKLQDGLLGIVLKRVVPDAMKPRRIEIGVGPSGQEQIEDLSEDRSAAA